MLKKLQDKPLWYKIWASSVALCAIYSLVIFFTSEYSQIDRFINVYVWASIVLDMVLYPKNV